MIQGSYKDWPPNSHELQAHVCITLTYTKSELQIQALILNIQKGIGISNNLNLLTLFHTFLD